MLNTRISGVAANAQLDSMAPLANGGFLRLYSGTQPAVPEDPPVGTLLAELAFGTPAFGLAVSKEIIANAIADELDAPASGEAAWFRVLKSDGTTALWDGSVGASNANCIMDSTTIVAGARISVTSFMHFIPLQGD